MLVLSSESQRLRAALALTPSSFVANAGAEEGGVVEFNVVVGELGHPVEKLSTPVRVYLVPGRHHVPDLGTGQARKLDQARVSDGTLGVSKLDDNLGGCHEESLRLSWETLSGMKYIGRVRV